MDALAATTESLGEEDCPPSPTSLEYAGRAARPPNVIDPPKPRSLASTKSRRWQRDEESRSPVRTTLSTFGVSDVFGDTATRPVEKSFSRTFSNSKFSSASPPNRSGRTVCSWSSKQDRQLPSLVVRPAHPQTFKETMLFSKPSQFPWNAEDKADVESPRRKILHPSLSAPQLGNATCEANAHGDVRRRSGRTAAEDPESLLSPFAVQVRKEGADIFIVGRRLRPSSGVILDFKVSQAEALGLPSQQVSLDDHEAVEEVLSHQQDVPTSPCGRASSSSALLRRTCSLPQKDAAYRLPSKNRPRTLSGQLSRLSNSPKHSTSTFGGSGEPSASRRTRHSRRAASPAEALGGTMLGEMRPLFAPGAEEEGASPSKCLPAAPPSFWDRQSKLTAVRGLYDYYAADPLTASAAALKPGRRPSSSSIFFERYLDRQAEIERLLQEQGKPPLVTSAGPVRLASLQDSQSLSDRLEEQPQGADDAVMGPEGDQEDAVPASFLTDVGALMPDEDDREPILLG